MTRKWINFCVILAFVMMTMPTVSHSMMPSPPAVSTDLQAQTAIPDCHASSHAGKAQKPADQAQDNKSTQNKCCDNDCQCFTGMCNGIFKVLGTAPLDLPYRAVAVYKPEMSDNRFLSKLQYHIKRPPRA